MEFARKAAQIEGWMSTFFIDTKDGSRGIGGLLATYWASSPFIAGPYIMNPYGLIRGLCARVQDQNSSEGINRAEKYAQYYLRCQDPTTGLCISTWGEDPFVGTGLVQQASVVAALWDLYRCRPQREIAAAAQKCWQACLHHPGMRLSWMVHNQALRSCEALILGIYARGETKPREEEKILLERVGNQVAKAQWAEPSHLAGAVSQACWDDNFIMPYQGKCLNPLIMLAEILDNSLYLTVAKRLADFLLKNITSGEDNPFIKGQYIAKGKRLPIYKKIYSLHRFSPFLESWLRRFRQRGIEQWQHNPWPQWLARGFDTARGLYNLGKVLKEEQYCRAALAMVEASLRYQSPLGGLRNTIGFFGEDPALQQGLSWQDVAPITRWNSYAVQFLHELAVGSPVLPPAKPEPDCQDIVRLANELTFIETPREVRLVAADQRPLWQVRKGNRWGRPFKGVQKGEGAAAVGRLRGSSP